MCYFKTFELIRVLFYGNYLDGVAHIAFLVESVFLKLSMSMLWCPLMMNLWKKMLNQRPRETTIAIQ
jgi:hypothetical protein